MLLICIVIIFSLINSTQNLTLLNLSNKQTSKLNKGDYIYSTLGIFRMSLVTAACSLKIQFFNGDGYRTKGYYPNNIDGITECQYLIVGQCVLLNSKGISLLKIDSAELSTPKQTTLTIDDLGIIRLTCIYSSRINLITEQVQVTTFREPSNLFYSTSQIFISEENTLSFRRNKRNWGFSAFGGEIKIFMLNDTSKIVRYKYSSFRINNAQLFDKDQLQPPSANFQGFKYEPRCGYIQFTNFRAPFVFEMNQYWPQLRVLDQGGYQLLSIRYPNFRCFNDLGLTSIIDSEYCMNWFCPPQTFQHQGKCITKCPSPFHHLIKQNGKNRCVLVCQFGSIYSRYSDMNICTCGQKWVEPVCQNYNSQYQMSKYPLGCTCSNKNSSKSKVYFNGYQCSTTCPTPFFPHEDGICVKCPKYCQYCVQSTGRMQFINYLNCLECSSGFQLIEGLCKKKCSGFGNQTICTACQVDHCLKCTIQSSKSCLICLKPFALLKNTCIRNCPTKYSLKFYSSQIDQQSYFVCEEIQSCTEVSRSILPINTCKNCNFKQDFFCWKSCEYLKLYNNRSSCFCELNNMLKSQIVSNNSPSKISSYGFVENCKAIKLKQFERCLYKYYFYQQTKQCLPCPFGCLSCEQDNDGLIQCTSCAPSYFLILNINQGHYCQRDTSIVSCERIDNRDKFYDPKIKACHYGNTVQQYRIRQNRILCFQKEPNCFTCLQKSKDICTFCRDGFVLYLGKCIKKCPQNTLFYHRVCLIYKLNTSSEDINQRLQNCQVLEIASYKHIINIDMESRFTQGYSYFLPKSQANPTIQTIDPIGKPFFYAQFASKNIKGSRQANFDEGRIICKVCSPFYGFNSLTQICEPCVQKQKCYRCANSLQNTCLQCHKNYNLNPIDGICQQKKDQQKNCEQNQFRNQNQKCSKFCFGFHLQFQNTTNQINCTKSCPYLIEKNQKNSEYLHCKKHPQKILEQYQKDQYLYMSGTHYKFTNNKHLFFLIPIQQKFKISPLITQNNPLACTYKQISNTSTYDCQLQQMVQNTNNVQNGQILSTSMVQTSTNNYYTSQQKIAVVLSQPIDLQMIQISLAVGYLTSEPPYLSNSKFIFTSTAGNYHQLLSTGISGYGKFYTIILFIITILFMGEDILYKTDNLFILFQTLPLFLFSLNLTISSTKDIYKFYYGFKWSIGHIFGAPHTLSIDNQNQTPYIENTPNTAHNLLNIDNNIIRNTYILLIILIISTILFLITYFIVNKLQSKSPDISKSYEPIYNNLKLKSKNYLIFIFENSCLVLIYYSVSNIQNQSWLFTGTTFRIVSLIFSGIIILSIVIYTILRLVINSIGGLYMCKRIYLGVILALIKGNSNIIIYAVFGQILFTIARFYLQIYQYSLTLKNNTSVITIFIIQQLLLFLIYILLGFTDQLSTNIQVITVIVIWLFINCGIVLFIMEIAQKQIMVLFYKNKKYDEKQLVKIKKQYHYIRNNWDYSKDISTNSSFDQLKLQ